MASITWTTPAGSLGTVTVNSYYEFPIAARASETLEYTHIAGDLPAGFQVAADGKIKGVAVAGSDLIQVSSFTVRANTPTGAIADRTFSISVSNYAPVQIQLINPVIGTYTDGSLLRYQFATNSTKPVTWSIVDGETPADLLSQLPISVTESGELFGYIGKYRSDRIPNSGYDLTNSDVFGYDFEDISEDRTYVFTVQASDGVTFDRATVQLNVVSKRQFTSDNSVISADNTNTSADTDNRYSPIITTRADSVPKLAAGDKFSFKFDAIDPEGDAIFWRVDSVAAAAGLHISQTTGWLTGTVPAQNETVRDYVFKVTAYKRDFPDTTSVPLTVTLTVAKNRDDFLTWVTSPDLGTVVNGEVSELAVSAESNTGRNIRYQLASGIANRLPQGLRLLDNGTIIGQASFRYFSLDGQSSEITVADSSRIRAGMAIQGPGVASGCSVTQVIDRERIKVAPAIYVAAGTVLTFSDLAAGTDTAAQLTDLSTTTQLDGGATTFDNSYKFTVVATTEDQSVTTSQQFVLRVNNVNRSPYENVYLAAQLSLNQRLQFAALTTNSDIFPEGALYRPQDPNFGVPGQVKFLFLPGVTPGPLNEYALSVVKNHYQKRLTFGEIKTAQAVGSDLTVQYEVVYVEVLDAQSGSPLEITPAISRFYNNNPAYNKIYPNSFGNMTQRVAEKLGFSNPGALPGWMTSRQENGKVLGLTHAVVLAYTVPGAAAQIAYNLSKSNYDFNSIDFKADRYQVAKGITATYNHETNSFDPSRETSFDLNGIGQVAGRISVSAGSRNVTGLGTDFTGQLTRSQTLYYLEAVDGTVSVNGTRVLGVGTKFTDLKVTEYLYGGMAPIGSIERIISDTELELALPAQPRNNISVHQVRRLGTVSSINSSGLLSLVAPSEVTLLQRNFARATESTRFDAANTLFYDNRDKFLLPGDGDKYVKWSQVNVFV